MKNQIDNKERWLLKLLDFFLENSLGTDWSMLKNENPIWMIENLSKSQWTTSRTRQSIIKLNRGVVMSITCFIEEDAIVARVN